VISIDIFANGYVHLMYSPTAVHSGPIALNLLHNALLRYYTGKDQYIKLISKPLLRPKQVKTSPLDSKLKKTSQTNV